MRNTHGSVLQYDSMLESVFGDVACYNWLGNKLNVVVVELAVERLVDLLHAKPMAIATESLLCDDDAAGAIVVAGKCSGCVLAVVWCRSLHNDFIKREIDLHPEFVGFMTLHQDLNFEEMKGEVERCKKAGFKGVKLHPDFQKFYIDEEKFQDILIDLLYKEKEFN